MLLKLSSVWRKKLQLVINIGGLFACVYVLTRRGKGEQSSKRGAEDDGEHQETNISLGGETTQTH